MSSLPKTPSDWKHKFQLLPHGLRGGGVLFIVWMLLPAACGIYLLANIYSVHHWLGGEDFRAALLFTLCYAVLTGLGILPTYAATIVGGWVFGLSMGFAVCAAGYLGGSALGFVISKIVCGQDVIRWIDANKKWSIIRRTFLAENFWKATGIMALLRLSPSGPFAVTNLVLTACGASWSGFIIGSSIGIAPRTLFACYMAATGAATGATDIQSLAKDQGTFTVIAGIFIFVVTLGVISVIARSALERALRDETA